MCNVGVTVQEPRALVERGWKRTLCSCATFAFYQEGCAFLRLFPKVALFCGNVALYENELNGRKTNKKPQSQCSILKHRYNATLKNYLGILTWYLTARRGYLISFDMRFTTVEK